MIKPALLASLRIAEGQESREGNVVLLRDTVLQSQTTLRVGGWSKGNLLRSVGHLNTKAFSVLALEANGVAQDRLQLHLGTKESLTLNEVLEANASRQAPLTIIFLDCGACRLETVQRIAEQCVVDNCIFIIAAQDLHRFYFAFACELTHWWDLQSCKGEVVTFAHLAACVETLASAYPQTREGSPCEVAVIRERAGCGLIAWSKGNNYAPSVDTEKFVEGARDEQLNDTIKRISDAANSPRQQHSSTQDRMVSSQGLFWLSEVLPVHQMGAWLADTRLYRECHPYASSVASAIVVRKRRNPDLSVIENLRESFVKVPGGLYTFGSLVDSIGSEPPASQVALFVPGFSIMRSPVTCGFLKCFVESQATCGMDNLPVTNVSFFDAKYIAQAFTELLQASDLEYFREMEAKLPTEYQWEAAARGLEGYKYPWGEDFNANLTNCEMRIGHPTPPGMFSPGGDSSFGCQDMSGNVREWTRSYGGTRGVDWALHTQQRVVLEEEKIVEFSRLVVKGGSYSYGSECVQAWVRNTQIANRRDMQTGFRLVLEPK